MVQQDTHLYEELFETVHQLVTILDGHGRIMKANQATVQLTGLSQEELVGNLLWEIPWAALSRENRREIKNSFTNALKGNVAQSELEFVRRGKLGRVIDLTLRPIMDDGEAIKFIVAEGRDISAYKRTSEALHQSMVRFATVFEKAGLGIVIEGPEGNILDCNPAFLSMLGYEPDELRQINYLEITYPVDRASNRKLFNELVNGKRESYSLVKRYLSKTNQAIWVSTTASRVRGKNEKTQFIIVMAENITSQKEAEAEVVELRQRLMNGREMERLKLAQDLHDGPLQEIIGITFQVKDLEDSIQNEDGREQIKSLQSALQQAAKSIRTICGELRPSTLVPFGLEKAILSHAQDFQISHPELSIELDLVHDGQSLPEQLRLALFRIYQEALNNILRHAKASTIFVRFHVKEEQAILEVEDNGTGFDLPKHWIELARNQHLGLVGSIERAKEAGGYLEVATSPGKGTLIRAVLPIIQSAKDQSAQAEQMIL